MVYGVFASLSGNEILQVTGITATGLPSGQSGQCTTGQIASLGGSNPVAFSTVGASATAAIGGKYLLSAATGSVLTLPNAIGSGGTIVVAVSTTVTSNAHKILAGRTADDLQGTIFTEDAGISTGWYAAISSTFNSLQLNGTTTGGFQGDLYEFRDIATNVWQVNGWSKSTGTAATPFSTADS